MSPARKLLVFGGIALAAFGMLYGLQYAVFTEHQTLDRMGGSLAGSFVQAADGNLSQAHSEVEAFGSTKYDYLRQVDVHSHWIGLAMLMIVLGAAFDHVGFGEGLRLWIASALLLGSAVFPLGVLLQTFRHGSAMASGLAIAGSALVIASLAATAVGFARQSA